jgi:hypothetical protein
MPRQSSSACSPAADPPHPWPAWAGGGRRGWVWRPWRPAALPLPPPVGMASLASPPPLLPPARTVPCCRHTRVYNIFI